MNRTINEFYHKVRLSKYVSNIRFTNTIHDAFYLLIKNDPETIKYVNDTLIECMEWQNHPAIHSDEVKLGAELDIGKSWDKQYTLANKMTLKEIEEFLKEKEL